MSKEWITHKITPEEEGRRIESILRNSLGFSRRMLQKLTRTDGFTLNGKKAHLDRKVQVGDSLKVCIHQGEEGTISPVEMPLVVAYEDYDLIIVNKPPGIEVHPPEQRAVFRPTLAHGIAHYFAEIGLKAKVRPLHRLDKDTSGLVVFAKNVFAHQSLDRQLRQRTLKRGYQAIVAGVPKESQGTLNFPIGRDPNHPLRRMVCTDGDTAVTHYQVLQILKGNLCLVTLTLDTGRTHQIRVHLSHIGLPVLGDRLYGGHSILINRQALHASSMVMIQPRTGEEIQVSAALPEDMQRLIGQS